MKADVSKTDASTFKDKKLEFYNEEGAVYYTYRTTLVGVNVCSSYTSIWRTAAIGWRDTGHLGTRCCAPGRKSEQKSVEITP